MTCSRCVRMDRETCLWKGRRACGANRAAWAFRNRRVRRARSRSRPSARKKRPAAKSPRRRPFNVMTAAGPFVYHASDGPNINPTSLAPALAPLLQRGTVSPVVGIGSHHTTRRQVEIHRQVEAQG
jgi:hypothetical protein